MNTSRAPVERIVSTRSLKASIEPLSARPHGSDVERAERLGDIDRAKHAVRDRAWRRLIDGFGAPEDPDAVAIPAEEAAGKKGAAEVARRVGVDGMRPVDLVVCGSVAVNRSGARIGKGAGYSDLEVALLIEAGLVTDRTVIVATVHPLQVVEEDIPETEHDFSVDYIVTPDEVIACPNPRRPRGLVWDDLTEEKIAAIPVLAQRRDGR
ncbi:5-formyltetrahydrofolate cyclo-ligase [Streptomyces sp. NPDC051217]|uniref:5-formyltetrahydrofolate cyclo-ligase n=1 Tax=Streptomyces sp. NPDC051217 TaxID=3365644 RepID=UPI0037A108E2